MLGLINEPLVTVIANDQYPAKASVHDINKRLRNIYHRQGPEENKIQD